MSKKRIQPKDLEFINNLSELHKLREDRGYEPKDDLSLLETAYKTYIDSSTLADPDYAIKNPNKSYYGFTFEGFVNAFDDIGVTKEIDIFKERMKDFPQYQDLLKKNDIDISSKLYDTLKSASNVYNQNMGLSKQFVDFLNDFAPKQNRFENKVEESQNFDKNLGSPFHRDRQKKLAEEGLSYTKMEIAEHLGLLDRQNKVLANKAKFAKSFGTNKMEGLSFLENVVQDYFDNEFASISYNDKVNELIAFDGKGKGVLLGTPGELDLSDFAEYIGGSIPTIADMIASSTAFIFGSAVPGVGLVTGPLASATASGFTVPIAEALRFAIGHSLFGEGKSFGEAYKQKYGEDKFSELDGLITGGVDTIYNIGRVATGTFGKVASPLVGKKYTVGDIEESIDALTKNVPGAEDSLEEIISFVDKFRRKQLELGATKQELLDLNLGQLSGNPILIQRYQAIKKDLEKYGPEAFKQAHGKDITNDNAINNMFGAIKKTFQPDSLRLDGSTNIDKSYLLKEIDDLFAEIQEQEFKLLNDKLVKSESSIADEAIKAGDKTYVEKGQQIKNAIVKIQDKALSGFDDIYTKMKFTTGKMYSAETTNITKVLDEIQNTYKKQAVDVQAQANAKNFINLDEVESFADLVNNLQIFRKKRLKGKYDYIDNKLLDNYEEAIMKDAKLATFDSEGGRAIYKTLEDVGRNYKNFKKKFNPFISKLINENNGRLPDGSNLFATTFKTTPDTTSRANINDIYNIIKDDATLMKDYRESIESFYLNKVFKFKDGKRIFDKNVHAKFMSDYEYGLKKFFGPKGFQKARRVGGLQKEVDRLTKLHDDALTDFQKIFPNADKFNAQSIFKVYKDGDVEGFEQALKIVNSIADKTGKKDLINNVRTIIADDIYANIKPVGKDGIFRVKEFSKILDGLDNPNIVPAEGSKAKLLQLAFGNDKVGKEYLEHLGDINRVLKMMTKKGVKDPTTATPQLLVNVLRSWIAPPLTRKGRVLTGAIGLAQTNFDKAIANLLTEPDALAQLAKLKKMNIDNPLSGDIINEVFGTNIVWTKKVVDKLRDYGSKIYTGTKVVVKGAAKEVTGIGTTGRLPKQVIKDVLTTDEFLVDEINDEDIKKYEEKRNSDIIRNNQSKLSQQPINVAQMKPQPQGSVTNNQQRPVASGSVTDKQQTLQGLASLGMNYFS